MIRSSLHQMTMCPATRASAVLVVISARQEIYPTFDGYPVKIISYGVPIIGKMQHMYCIFGTEAIKFIHFWPVLPPSSLHLRWMLAGVGVKPLPGVVPPVVAVAHRFGIWVPLGKFNIRFLQLSDFFHFSGCKLKSRRFGLEKSCNYPSHFQIDETCIAILESWILMHAESLH